MKSNDWLHRSLQMTKQTDSLKDCLSAARIGTAANAAMAALIPTALVSGKFTTTTSPKLSFLGL
jgi:hypothetical protein